LVSLAFEEYKILQTPLIEKTTTVSTDPSKHPHISINLDIIFPNIPCFLIEPAMRTSVNFLPPHEIINNLTWTHVDANENVIRQYKKEKPFAEFDLNNDNDTPKEITNFF
jgi:hypothetical protein